MRYCHAWYGWVCASLTCHRIFSRFSGSFVTQFDFAIIGYGPVGATIANMLGQEGFAVALIDRHVDIYDKPRAITGDHEFMRAFQYCGLGDAVDAITAPHIRTDYVGIDSQVIKKFNPSDDHPLGWPPAMTFIQPELEAVLRRGVARFENVQTFLGWTASIINHDETEAEIHLTPRSEQNGETQQPETINARTVIACDGAGSTVREHCGIGVEDLGFNEWWMVIDAWERDISRLPDRTRQYCWPSRPGTHVIGPRGLRRWEIKLLPGETPNDFATDEAKRAVLSKFVDPDAVEIWRSAVYQFHAIVAKRWRDGCIFLMGDAAHQMPPFLGQGLCAGVRDALNFAWKVVQVERYGASCRLLDSYQHEREAHVKTVVANAIKFGLIIGELDEDAARERDKKLQAELAAGTAITIRQKFIPGLVDGVLARQTDAGTSGLAPLAGTLFVQPKVLDAKGDEKLLDDVTGTGFLLIGTEDIIGRLMPATRKKWQQLAGKVVTVGTNGLPAKFANHDEINLSETDGLFHDWCAANSIIAAIVRPDRYVYGVAGHAETLADHVNSLYAQLFD